MTLFDTVLLTGCSEHISQGLSQILRMTGAARRVIGCDTHTHHPGELLFDGTEVIAGAEDPAFPDVLADVARRHQADLVVPVFEAEIGLMVREGTGRLPGGIPVLLPSAAAVTVGLDKLATARFLEHQGLDHPWTEVAGEAEPRALPCVLKPRRGNAGHGLVGITDPCQVDCYRRLRPQDIWQEYLEPEDQEYTCGLYRTVQGEVRVMASRRVWRHGKTWAGTVTRDRRIDEYLRAIAEGLELRGSVNVQLRLTERGPVAFEINPRFSGTVVFRHLLGFEDFLWSLQEARGLAPTPFQGVPMGARFFLGAKPYCLPAPVAGSAR